MNIYKDILKKNLGKLLNLYDMDPSSPTLGYGDRSYWGWKTSDYANATLQGGVHSLAIALKLNLYENKEVLLLTIDQAINAIPSIQDTKGGLQEAYPLEHSFCVTALVAFDVLSAVQLLDLEQAKKDEYLSIVEPLIEFISKYDEEHAIISNHLATAVAAIALWNKTAKKKNNRDKELLQVIYNHQSKEGWHKEYEGADQGYQTLCIYYLSAAYIATKDNILKDSIAHSLSFLKYYIHPDNTVGGLYGSRNTEVYYPGGVVALSNVLEDANIFANAMKDGITQESHLLPENIDAGNYIPLLNSYAFAALHYEETNNNNEVPCKTVFEKDFSDAGIFVKSTNSYYSIVNYKKGGTIKVFNKTSNQLDIEDGGLLAIDNRGRTSSTQQYDSSIDFSKKEITANFYLIDKSSLTPIKMILLRLLSLTVFKSIGLGNSFKKMVVKKLMTGKNKTKGKAVRKFHFTENKIQISESIISGEHFKSVNHAGKFKAIHMASSGYYTKQTIPNTQASDLVEYNRI